MCEELLYDNYMTNISFGSHRVGVQWIGSIEPDLKQALSKPLVKVNDINLLVGSVQSSASSSLQKIRILPFTTSTTSSRRKTYTYYSGTGSGNGGRKGGSGSKGHTQCPHCGYTMFHKDTSVCKLSL